MFLFIGNFVFAESSSEKQFSNSTQSSSLKKAFYVAVGVGAITSGIVWMPGTRAVIAQYGVLEAIYTTHIPRILLDVATVIVCYNAYSDENNR